MKYIVNSETGERTLVPNTTPLEEYKWVKIEDLRILCRQAVEQFGGLDEATQQNASHGIYPPERCEAIKSYIASCRNEYLRCKGLILAAQTNDEADAIQYVAPPVPEGL